MENMKHKDREAITKEYYKIDRWRQYFDELTWGKNVIIDEVGDSLQIKEIKLIGKKELKEAIKI